MKIYRNIPDNKNLFKNPVVTIGNFDGVHLGHQKIISHVLSKSREIDGDPVVITFAKHPRKILYPEHPIKIVTTSEEKVNAIFNFGIDNIILLNFTREMSQMSAKSFYNDILIKQIDIKHLVIGYDHAFGKNREGTFDYLNELCDSNGIVLTRVEGELYDSQPISSTWLRKEIKQGNLKLIKKLLNRNYTLTGTVVKGYGRGKKLGYPTANIQPLDQDKIIPGDGVYAASTVLRNGTKKLGMLNIGNNPTFNQKERTIEINIFDFNEDIYDSEITVEFHEKIREERTFSSKNELIEQMAKDQDVASKILSEIKN